MQWAHNIRSFLLEEELQIHVYKNKVNVVNYSSIGHFDSEKVMIRHPEGTITIHGKELVVSRLLHNEILVTGNVQSLEFR